MLNVLTEPVIRVRTMSGERTALSLPQVLALLARDAVAEVPALRPHQRHRWHAFLVQLAAIALHRAGLHDVPADEGDWAALIRGLTPEWPDDEPWNLVTAPDRPALLQAPVPGDLSAFKTVVDAPEALDMLVTSRNHDLKAEVMGEALPDDWLFALVSLQTMEGFMGQGNYGISRMNGGFSNRPALGVVPPGGPGAHVRRDVHVLLNGGRDEILRRVALKESGGLGLVWLQPWDGVTQIAFEALDPLYIEICRRVRLQDRAAGLHGLAGNSRRARIASDALSGNTGDPWTPIEVKGAKALSITGEGFSYRRMVELLLGNAYRRPVLQELHRDDPDQGLAILARGLARGQGKTEGYHERVVPISREAVRFFRSSADPLADMAKSRVSAAAVLRGRSCARPCSRCCRTGRTRSRTGRGRRRHKLSLGSTASSGGWTGPSSPTSGGRRPRQPRASATPSAGSGLTRSSAWRLTCSTKPAARCRKPPCAATAPRCAPAACSFRFSASTFLT